MSHYDAKTDTWTNIPPKKKSNAKDKPPVQVVVVKEVTKPVSGHRKSCIHCKVMTSD